MEDSDDGEIEVLGEEVDEHGNCTKTHKCGCQPMATVLRVFREAAEKETDPHKCMKKMFVMIEQLSMFTGKYGGKM